jgi:WD40 repeat protein
MTDREHPFDPQEVEKQVDQLSASARETYGTSDSDQRFLHDLRLVLAAADSDARAQTDEHFLQRAWTRIEATGLSQDTMQRAYPPAIHRRFIVMSTLPSAPENSVSRRGKFKRRLTTLAAAIIALALVCTLTIFALAAHTQSQTNTATGASPTATATTASPNASNYVYHQAGLLPVYNLQWSPDGTRIISSNENIYSWDAFSGAHALKYAGSSAPKPQILFSQLSPNGRTLAVWNVGQIDLYNVASGKHLSTLSYPFSQATGVKLNTPGFGPYIGWSPDSSSIRALAHFPTSNNSLTNKLVTYNVATGAHQDLQLSLDGLLDQAAWSPNGKYVAVGHTSDGAVSVIDIANGHIVSTLHAGAPIETIPLNWSPDSSKLVADFGDNSGLYVWNAATGQDTLVFQTKGTQPTWSPNGKYIAVTADTTVQILNASNGKLLHTYTSQASNGYSSLAWSPDSSALAAGARSAAGNSGIVNVWKVTL